MGEYQSTKTISPLVFSYIHLSSPKP